MNLEELFEGLPEEIPPFYTPADKYSHPPKRKDLLNAQEKIQAIKNALRYFPNKWHTLLAQEFADELKCYGRIYMYRFKPKTPIKAYSIDQIHAKSKPAAAIILMILNNLDPDVAQHPEELITYGGNGSVFQNWVQFRLTLHYLFRMNDGQTLVLNSGHPMGLYPSFENSPRLVISNGMMIPNYSSTLDYEKMNALGVTQYGQMTAGSFMYIGPQGIVHGTTITLLNAKRKVKAEVLPLLFVSSGMGGMSGAQTKAANIAGVISIVAEINPLAGKKRHRQGWVDFISDDLDWVLSKALELKANKQIKSICYIGNIVDLWAALNAKEVKVDLGSDQTSLHNPYAGGYYPVGLTFQEANRLMVENPLDFKQKVGDSLKQQVSHIQALVAKGMYFFDYGNAFLLECGRAGAPVYKNKGALEFIYPSYVQDIMGPLCFDYGFGPFRWVCCSGNPKDLAITDKIALEVLSEMLKGADDEIQNQLKDNMHWIDKANDHQMVVGSQSRILYADAVGRVNIAKKFNEAIGKGIIGGAIVLGRDHHDVSGTDSPFRETSNIYDGSRFTADMAIQNAIGDAFRGATWVSIHNGGGVGWGEAINGGFGLVLDGSALASEKCEQMLFWDVNNGVGRRSWAGNKGAVYAIKKAMETNRQLEVLIPNVCDENILEKTFKKVFD